MGGTSPLLTPILPYFCTSRSALSVVKWRNDHGGRVQWWASCAMADFRLWGDDKGWGGGAVAKARLWGGC